MIITCIMSETGIHRQVYIQVDGKPSTSIDVLQKSTLYTIVMEPRPEMKRPIQITGWCTSFASHQECYFDGTFLLHIIVHSPTTFISIVAVPDSPVIGRVAVQMWVPESLERRVVRLMA